MVSLRRNGATDDEKLADKLNLVLKRLAALEDMFQAGSASVLLGDKFYMQAPLQTSKQQPVTQPAAYIESDLLLETSEVKVGEDINIVMKIENKSNFPVLLMKIEGISPSGFEVVDKPAYCSTVGNNLELNGRRLNQSMTETMRISLRSFKEGAFKIKPKIFYISGTGEQLFCEPAPIEVHMSKIILPGRIMTGFKELDTLLFGGIPENYAVLLTSVSSDERDLLIQKFLEKSVKENQITFYMTIEPSGVKTLAEKYQSSFYLFICNPQADAIIKDLPNIYKLKGVENITEINIALTSALRRITDREGEPKRACIEIVSDVLLQHKAIQTRRWLTGLIPDLKSKGFTTLAVLNPHMHLSEEVHAILDLFDGEINLEERGSKKYLKIKKLYNEKYLESELSLSKVNVGTARSTREGKWVKF